MAIALHIVNVPDPDARQRYESVFVRLDEIGARHPQGRISHVAWTVGDEFHVLDVWESQASFDAYFQTLRPIIEESGMRIAGPPQVGDVVQILLPEEKARHDSA